MDTYLWSLFTKTGVYTKNRNFRLYKSSKVGKNAAFTVAEDNKFIAKPEKGISAEESVFLASLVCNLRYIEHLNLKIQCAEVITNHRITAHFFVSLVSQVREFSHGTFQKQRRPKPQGFIASRDQPQIQVALNWHTGFSLYCAHTDSASIYFST